MQIGAPPLGETALRHEASQQQHQQSHMNNNKTQHHEEEKQHTREFRHPDGFTLSIRRSLIPHPAAGYGVFVDRPVRAGTLVALYPGRLHAPPELTADIVKDNEYMISFLNGWVLDGREWHRRGERFEQRLDSIIQVRMSLLCVY